MSVPEKPTKAVVTVVEMAEMCRLSRSRFYSLIDSGIFPEPVRNDACKRPVFDLELQQKCLDIRRTGIGANGQPIVFNRKRKPTAAKRPKGRPVLSEHAELVESLKSLGMQATAEAVEEAMRELYPEGIEGIDEGEQVRHVFLYLQMRR